MRSTWCVVVLSVLGGCATTVSGDSDAAVADAERDGAVPPADVDPVPPRDAPAVTAARASHLAADSHLTCAIGDDGRVRCWGYYTGFVYSTEREAGVAPTIVPGVEGATSLAVSRDHACAVVAAGAVVCWGFNTWGQLGLPRDNPDQGSAFHATAVRVAGLAPARSVAVGWLHSCALLEDATVSCWGHDGLSQLPVAQPRGGAGYSAAPAVAPGVTDVVQLDSHGSSTCARASDGSLRCWGENAYGEDGPRDAGRRVNDIAITRAVDVFTQVGSSYALTADGTVYRWGAPPVGGMAGDGIPRALGVLEGATRIVAPWLSTCALVRGGVVRCLPSSPDHAPSPDMQRIMDALPPAREVSLGFHAACFVDLTGGLYCLGENPRGELGTGERASRSAAEARVALRRVTRVMRGAEFACGLTDAGLYCWGGNFRGDVGVGAVPDTAQPAPARLPLEGVTDMAAYNIHACVVSRGEVHCWGENGHGEVSPGGPAVVTAPTRVALPATAEQVVLGASFACARTAAGVYCWGDDQHGQVGDARFLPTLPPTRIALPGAAVSLAAGSEHACAALATGAVYCWGDNRRQQVTAEYCGARCLARLRSGDIAHARVEEVPVQRTGVAGARALRSAGDVVCALDAMGGTCWPGASGPVRLAVPGARFHGTGLAGTTLCAGAPGSCVAADPTRAVAPLPAVDRFVDLSFDSSSGCAVDGAGDLRCWGDGARGQLGTGDGFLARPVALRW
jgi:alpha-tubulin suppressor-like RCC1 family protein